jgi:hypothetical protein
MLLNILEHPVTAHVILMSTSDAKESTMITDNCSAKLWDVIFEVDEVLALFMCRHIIEMNILVTPLEVMDDALISQLFLNNENILEEVDYPLFNIKMIELGNHRLLIFQIALVLINQCISFVNNISNVVKHSRICAQIKLSKLVRQILILFLLFLHLIVHVLNLDVVALQFSNDELMILSPSKFILNLCKAHRDVR